MLRRGRQVDTKGTPLTKAGQINKGMFILVKNEPHLVADREFVNPGKGQAFVRLKLKSVKTGLVVRQTFKSPESVEDVEVDAKPAQFLYHDDDSYHFMDTESYEQLAIPKDGLEDRQSYLKEGDTFELVVYDDQPIDIKIPLKMVLEVTDTEPAAKGDTVTGATKLVTVETGYQVKVPLFMKTGDRVRINTETGEYLERVN